MNLADQLQALEEKLLQPDVRKDSLELGELLADDFKEFGSSGRVFDKIAIICELRNEVSRELPRLNNFQAFPLSQDIVLVTYISSRISDGETLEFLRSSIWVNQSGAWKLRFHQGTRLANRALIS